MDPFAPKSRRPRRRGDRSARTVLVALASVALALFLLAFGAELYTEWLWFDSVGYVPSFAVVLGAQVGLFLVGALLFGGVFALNTWLARRFSHRLHYGRGYHEGGLWEDVQRVVSRLGDHISYRRSILVGSIGLGVGLATILGLALGGSWLTFLLFANGGAFGVADPLTGLDVGFFVFQLPFYRLVHSWLLGVLVFVAGTTLATYALTIVYDLGLSLERTVFALPRRIKAHVLGLAAVLFVLIAANHVLDLLELVYSSRNVTGQGLGSGAGYTDAQAQLPALAILAGFALLAAALTVLSIFRRGVRFAVGGATLWLGSAILIGVVWPNAVQQFVVTPNALERERPYIERTIAMTRLAFGLDRSQEIPFPVDDAVRPEDIRNTPETVRNIRIWDQRTLVQTLRAIQSLTQYYTFVNVDVDRYVVDGRLRQVMLAARELDLASLQLNWVNERLVYTHSYGVVMAPANAVTENGRPELLIKDVPPVSSLPLSRPEIYFGEVSPQPYVVLKTTEQEVDYPTDRGTQYTRYQGRAGVNVGGLDRRLAYAIRFRDANLLLSSAFTPTSEIVYRRGIAERVRRLAPFLLIDRDPYLVISQGRLFWIVDTYTHTRLYPYSQRTCWTWLEGGRACAGPYVNYARNSVKAVVDAYDGSVRLYVADPADPLVAAYGGAFPGLFQPLEELSSDLRAHLRYPRDLFELQARVLARYHVQDPNTFFSSEDVWEVPKEKFGRAEVVVEPYYAIMRLPNEPREEFLLMLPYVPAGGRTNMVAWMAASSDEPNRGMLRIYRYPREKLVPGPGQIDAATDQDKDISKELTLWNQQGSQVIRGSTLVIPVGGSNLYVEPVYLQADTSTRAIPELKQVIASTGGRVVMEPTLERALARLFSPGALEPGAGLPEARGGAPEPSDVAGLAAGALQSFQRAKDALRAWDLARFGEEMAQLEQRLRRLAEQTGPPTSR